MRVDRAGELIDRVKHGRKELITPEGVTLTVHIASHGERLGAFMIDMAYIMAANIGFFILLNLILLTSLGQEGYALSWTFILFAVFIVRNMYFLHFELAWQGRTPGKKANNLKVINREGGELSPSAIVARNLTREVEIFLPLSLLIGFKNESGELSQLALLGWALALTAVPCFNREHLRAGDLIGGTQVIAMPKRVLLKDLTEDESVLKQANETSIDNYVFTYEQLDIYGNLELQVLEEILRRPANAENDRTLSEVCDRICRKIGWEDPVLPNDVRRFLNDFYAAERAKLERGQLFGHIRADKTASPNSEKQE